MFACFFRAQETFYASHKQQNRAQKTLRRGEVENGGEFNMMNEWTTRIGLIKTLLAQNIDWQKKKEKIVN